MTLVTKRDVALPIVLLPCLAGVLIASLAMAQSPVTQSGAPQSAAKEAAYRAGSDGKLPPFSTAVFIENLGQFDSKVRYQVKMGEQTAWLTANGIVFDATRATQTESVEATSAPHAGSIPLNSLSPSDHATLQLSKFDRLVFTENFVSATCCTEIEGTRLRPGSYNYFESNDSTKWRTNVHGYSEVIYRDVWPGVDLRLYGNGLDLEQEFILQPGADLTSIRMTYRGVDKVSISADGSLQVNTAFGTLRETKPQLYQQIAGKRLPVDGRFKLTSSNSYSFEVGTHQAGYGLIIDPTLLYSTFLGGSAGNNFYTSNQEYATGIAVDSSGNAYVAGNTASTDFPTTPGSYQASPPSGAFIAKLNATGSALAYATYLGWSTTISAIAVDSTGQAYVTGVTGANCGGCSDPFPTTSNAYWPRDNQHACSSSDFFMTELNAIGNKLVYSTCFNIDGNAAEGRFYGFFPRAITVDSNGHAIVAGGTAGYVPTTSNAYQPSFPGGASAFISVFDTTASSTASLVYSTYLGPSGTNPNSGASAYGTAFDSFGKVYLTGSAGPGFPITAGAFQIAHSSASTDAFVAKIDPSASGQSSLIYSSYLGGGPFCSGGCGGNTGSAITVDASGSAYVAGVTQSPSFPTTPGAFQANCPGYPGYVFVSKVSAGGSRLVYSTCLAGNLYANSNSVGGIVVDSVGNAYIAGGFRAQTQATFPTTPDAFQNSFSKLSGDYSEAFLTKLNATGSALIYSSYLGGNGDDVATGVAIDQTGDAYVAGHTSSFNFPVSAAPFQPAMNGSGDVFVAKFPLGTSQSLAVTSITPASGGNTGTVSPQIFGAGFHAGATAKLNCGAQAPIAGTNLTVSTGGRLLNTTFNLAGVQPTTCDVVASNPDGTSAALSQAFIIQQGGIAKMRIYLTGVEARKVPPEVASGPANTVMAVTVSNTGSVDSAGGFVTMTMDAPFTVTSASPMGLASVSPGDSGGFEVWSSVPVASGSSQSSTATAATMVATACGSPPLGVQACFTPDECYVDKAKLKACTGTGMIVDAGCEAVLDACAEGVGEVSAWTFLGCLAAGGACSYLNHKAIENCMDAPGVEVCHQGAKICISDQLPCVQPTDPNNLAGPIGVGSQRWLAGGETLSYVVTFQNESTATAPAQQVMVTQPLGANVNLSTLKLLGIILPNGTSTVQVPAPPGAFNPAGGVNEYVTNVDLRPTQDLLVNVDLKLNSAAQTITWMLTSIDPTTGLPPFSPLIGFLPAGASANVSFSIAAKPSLTTGAQVADQATVVFDGQSPMSTSTWINTIDNSAPVSQVAAIPATSTCPNFRVGWSGSDTGSGIQGFTVYASDNGGPFGPWLSNTTAAAATYAGAVGHAYSFYSVASDLVGNNEAAKSSAETSTTVTAGGPCGAPSLSGQISSVSKSGTVVTENLALTNTGFTAAQAVNINQITLRTLSGAGRVSLASPILPAAEGPLGIGASVVVPLTLNVPATVTRFSITESGTIQDRLGNGYSYSIAQTVVP